MKYSNSVILIMLTIMSACSTHVSGPENVVPLYSEHHIQAEHSDLATNALTESQPGTFVIDFNGLKLSATADSSGVVTILNYPSQWTAKVSLIRFDGEKDIESPFSLSHCEEIRKLAAEGFAVSSVRGGFRSVLSFELPPFLSYDFMSALREAANLAGHQFSAIFLKNPVDVLSGTIDLSFTPRAISRLIGQMWVLSDQLNLSQKGMLKGPFEQQVIVSSGDLICDLISEAATMTMTYPIKGSAEFIKVVYSPLEVKLKPIEFQNNS